MRLRATLAAELLLQDRQVQQQLAEARSSLRAALGLAPLYPLYRE
jgi:hypothetical protein